MMGRKLITGYFLQVENSLPDHPGRRTGRDTRRSGCLYCLLQICQQIVDMFNANRQAHGVFRHTCLELFFGIKLSMRRGRRVTCKGLGITNIHQTRK